MIEIENVIKILEVSSNATGLLIFTLVGCYAIIAWVNMNKKVKQAIIEEKLYNIAEKHNKTGEL